MKNEEKLIKSGNLLKKGKINKSWQKRWCILSKESKLFYHKSPTEKHSGFVDLNQCIIKQSECTEKEFIFEINTSNRIFLFSAETRSEMEDWMRKIYTHSKIQKENDLLERAEYIIRDQALWKSNLEDEFLKLKHVPFNPYIFNQFNNMPTTPISPIKNNSNNNNNNNNNNSNDEIVLEDDSNDFEIYNFIPSSLLSFNFHQQQSYSSSPSSSYSSIDSINSNHPPPLSYYNSLSTKQLFNHFNSISNHEFKHPLNLINNQNNQNGNSSMNMSNILNNSLNYNNMNNNSTFTYTSSSVSTYTLSQNNNNNNISTNSNHDDNNLSPTFVRSRSRTTHDISNTTNIEQESKNNSTITSSSTSVVSGDKAGTSRRFSFLGISKTNK